MLAQILHVKPEETIAEQLCLKDPNFQANFAQMSGDEAQVWQK